MAGNLWPAIDTQRTALATLLADLTAAEWARPSLCAGWTIRDVTGHLLLQAHPAEMLWLARHAVSGVHDAIRRSGIRLAGRYDTSELTAAVGGLSGTRRRFPYATTRSALVDVGVPLNRPIAPPPQVTAAAATEVAKHAPRPPRILKATDVEWQHGEGPLLEAPIADLLLVLTGRVTP